ARGVLALQGLHRRSARPARRDHVPGLGARLGEGRSCLARALPAPALAPAAAHRAARLRPGPLSHARRARVRSDVGQARADRELRRRAGPNQRHAEREAALDQWRPGRSVDRQLVAEFGVRAVIMESGESLFPRTRENWTSAFAEATV